MIDYLGKIAYIASYRSNQRIHSTRLSLTIILGNFISAIIAFIIEWKGLDAEYVWTFGVGYILMYLIARKVVNEESFKNIDNSETHSKRGLYTLLCLGIMLVTGLLVIVALALGSKMR